MTGDFAVCERLQLVEGGEGFGGFLIERHAEGRGLHAAASALEQLVPDLVLEVRDGFGHCLDGDELGLRRLGERSRLVHGDEIANLPDVHVLTS